MGVAIAGLFAHSAALSSDFIPIGLLFLGVVAFFSLLIGLGSYFLRERLGLELYLIYLFITGCVAVLLVGGGLFWY